MSCIPSIRVHKASQLAYVRINGKDRYLGPTGSPQVFERYAAQRSPLCRPDGIGGRANYHPGNWELAPLNRGAGVDGPHLIPTRR